MSLVGALECAGYKPEKSTEGEFQPLKGTYKCVIEVIRQEDDEKNNAKFIQVEYKPMECLEGDPIRDGFNFRKRVQYSCMKNSHFTHSYYPNIQFH